MEQIGLLLNFNALRRKDGVHRMVLSEHASAGRFPSSLTLRPRNASAVPG